MIYATEQLEQMLSDATPGEWLYRPDHLDDWGTVKSGPFVICRARDPRMMADEVLMAHRKNGSDPWEHNARLISLTPTITAELIAARRKLEAVTWQPIETAPKDGAPFLGCDADFTYVAIWDIGNRVHLTDTGRGFCYPTHWMPLPAPPEATP